MTVDPATAAAAAALVCLLVLAVLVRAWARDRQR
jgi:hypothetical protein